MKYSVSFSNSESYIGVITSNDFSFPFNVSRKGYSQSDQETIIEQNYPAIEGLLVDINKKDYFNFYIAFQQVGNHKYWTGFVYRNVNKIQVISKVPIDFQNGNIIVVKENETDYFSVSIKILNAEEVIRDIPKLIPDTLAEN